MYKTLKFKPHLVELILSGEKTVTWRLFDDKELKEGDKVEIVNSETGELAAHALIENVYTKPLSQVTDDDYVGHEKYNSFEEMLNTFRGYYGEKVAEDTELKIITFKIV